MEREGVLDIGSDGLNQTSLAVEGFELDLNQKLDQSCEMSNFLHRSKFEFKILPQKRVICD